MAGGGFGSVPWGSTWGSTGSPSTEPEHIPNSPVWNAFDLMGVRQANDMDRVQVFVEVTTIGQAAQFFPASFNICSGGIYPTNPAILDIDLTVPETFTVEWRVKFNSLPDDWTDITNSHILFGVNNASSACASLMFSKDGVGYTGAFHFDGSNQLILDSELNPSGSTIADRFLFIIPGSKDWFAEGDEVYIRMVVDWQDGQGLVYLFITPVADISPGVPGSVDSSGHVLVALLPLIYSSDALFPSIDRISNSVRGTAPSPSCVELFHYNLTYRALIPNLPPRAVTGPDQAIRICGIVELDGSASFDPEGQPLQYEWRLVDAPITSQYVFASSDGQTDPGTGFTDIFYSVDLGVEDTVEPIQVGDVLMVGGVGYTIASKKPEADPPPFYVVAEKSQIPEGLGPASFKLIRQAGVSGRFTAKPTFYPDVPGFYLFDLRVFDGIQWSTPTGLQRATSVVNVLESPLPRACTPNVDFLFDYLGDFWKLVEDGEKISTFWGALSQVAATELYTLWQHEYSKSIRDIQRTFIRRWLHYDTVLGEPIPELTRTKPVWGGVVSVPFSELRVNGQSLVLSSSLFSEDQVLTFSTRDPVDPMVLLPGLRRKLRTFHPSFDVELITLGSGQHQLRVDAGFAFSIANGSTCPLFTVGDENKTSVGVGSLIAERTFKVDRSLQGMGLSEACLVLGDVTYTIDRIVNVPGDAYPYQRLVVREQIPDSLPESTPWVIAGWVSSELLDFYNGLASAGDHVDFEVVGGSTEMASTAQTAEVITTTAYGVSESFPSRLAVDFSPLGHYLVDDSLSVRLAKVVRRCRIPVDESVVDVPTLQEEVVIEDDTTTLRRNLDFFIEQHRGRNSIRFVSGQSGSPDVFEGKRPPDRLWAEYTYLDNSSVIEANFGLAVGLTKVQLEELPETVDYLSAVSGLLYAYTNGPTVRNLRIGTQILIGLPFAEEDGTIEEIRKDLLGVQGRLLIRDTGNPEIVRSYTFPKALEMEVNPRTGERYKVGDAVVRFDPLVEGAEVLDYIKDPTWYRGILNQGVFFEVQKYHTFVVRVDGRAFNLSSLLFVRNFILKIKPTYTYPKFIVSLYASDVDGDEISVNDTITYQGYLSLESAICAGYYGASTVFDQPWPAGGQPWSGDPAGHNHAYRNQYDADPDPSTPEPTYPTPDPLGTILWGFDKNHTVCPYDELSVFDPSVPAEVFKGDETEPVPGSGFSIPSGAVGYVLTLNDYTVDSTGSINQARLCLLGITGDPLTDEVDFELVIRDVTAATQVTYGFTAATNTEVLASVSLVVTAGDTIQVSIRTLSQNAANPGWTRIITKVIAVSP